MDTIEAEAKRNAKRDIIRRSLNDILEDIEVALGDASYSVFLSVPNTGISLATLTSPLNPSEEEWNGIVKVACEVIHKRLGIRLHGHPYYVDW